MERDFLASGNTFLSIFQTFLSVIYADTRHICQLFPLLVETNPQFWPMKTDFLASGNHFLPISQICSKIPSIGRSFSISWKYVLNESFITVSCKEFSVQWKQYFSFRFFWKPLLQLEGGQVFFTKNLISARRNRFLQFFSDTDSNGSVIFVQ